MYVGMIIYFVNRITRWIITKIKCLCFVVCAVTELVSI